MRAHIELCVRGFGYRNPSQEHSNIETKQNFKIANLTTSHALKHKNYLNLNYINILEYVITKIEILKQKKKKRKRKEKFFLEQIPQTQSFSSLRIFCENFHLWFTISCEYLCFPLGFLSVFEIYYIRLYIVEKMGLGIATRWCEIHSKSQSLMQKTFLS